MRVALCVPEQDRRDVGAVKLDSKDNQQVEYEHVRAIGSRCKVRIGSSRIAISVSSPIPTNVFGCMSWITQVPCYYGSRERGTPSSLPSYHERGTTHSPSSITPVSPSHITLTPLTEPLTLEPINCFPLSSFLTPQEHGLPRGLTTANRHRSYNGGRPCKKQ
jgi:hypothetical protein